ncbi:replication endonuclease [Methylibium rhizosphaerae]|uniref:replication endonuclease n=1 Tax=Methylibium rhizosphaerae TaxID=2570323 RepID=UPI0011268B2B|nr:replication endonuclease [Methylibium rhizosphaerae]
MPTLLPTAIAVALNNARARYLANKGDPGIPFIPDTHQGDPRQADALPAAPASLLPWHDWKAQLLAQAGAVLPYLRHSHAQLQALAQRLPQELEALSAHEACATEDERLVAAAERRFGEPVPGDTPATQAARVRDAKYWRRFLTRRVRQARERLHLQLGLVGKGGRQYCSDGAREHRQMQLKQQAEWLKTTVLRGVVGGRVIEMPLEQVAKGPKQKRESFSPLLPLDQLLICALCCPGRPAGCLSSGPWIPVSSSPWNGRRGPEEARCVLPVRRRKMPIGPTTRRNAKRPGRADRSFWFALDYHPRLKPASTRSPAGACRPGSFIIQRGSQSSGLFSKAHCDGRNAVRPRVLRQCACGRPAGGRFGAGAHRQERRQRGEGAQPGRHADAGHRCIPLEGAATGCTRSSRAVAGVVGPVAGNGRATRGPRI